MGMVTILAMLAFINHSAHSMEATEVIRRITEETRTQIAKLCPSPEPQNPVMAAEKARAAVRLGRTRTIEQDLTLGFQQLVNITLRALSPGVNDPTIAREAIVYLGLCCGICCCGGPAVPGAARRPLCW
jgi:uncharacterized membrane protein